MDTHRSDSAAPNADAKARAEEIFLRYVADRDLTNSDEFDAFTHEYPDVQEELRRLGADFMVMEERLEVAYPSLVQSENGVRLRVNYAALAAVLALAVSVGVGARFGFGASVGVASLAGAVALVVGLVASLALRKAIAVQGE